MDPVRRMTVEVVDFGCRLNLAEGATIGRLLEGQVRDTTVINGCAVTGEAVRQTAQAVRRARRARPDAQIVVTGCAAQVDQARFSAMAEVDLVLGNREKLVAENYGRPGVNVSNVMIASRRATPVVSGRGQTRSFVEIQTGCDHRCTFCIIPFGRGDSISVPLSAVVEAVARAVDEGQREVVLTGVDLTSYRPSLATLVSQILREVPALPRLRLSSLDPAEVDAALFELIVGEPRVMPHVHLSLQSGDSMILKRMKRRHTRAQAIELVQRLKAARPALAIGADLIAGFPTESAAMHDNNLSIIEACDVVFGHVFPYSPRVGTPAARMPPVAADVAKTRAHELRSASAKRRAAWLSRIEGSTQNVLVERSGLRGHAENFASVLLTTPCDAGSIVAVRIVATDGDTLSGVPV